jgi:hypothetical protein
VGLAVTVALVAMAATAPRLHSAAAVVYGDLDGDGSVTIKDVIWSLKIDAGLAEPTPEQVTAGDVSPYPGDSGRAIGDGSLGISDTIRLLRFVAGIIPPADFAPGPPSGDVSFSKDIQPILQQTCESFMCHGGPLPKGGLKMSGDAEYDSLVNTPSLEADGVLRVKPRDPDHSYLLAKLMGTQKALGGTGERMPAGEALIPPPLPPEQVDLFRRWIAAGAPNN